MVIQVFSGDTGAPPQGERSCLSFCIVLSEHRPLVRVRIITSDAFVCIELDEITPVCSIEMYFHWLKHS